MENDFLKEIVKNMLKDGELQKLKMKSEYDDVDRKWTVPPFFLKAKEVNLPKIKGSKQLVEAELEKRDMEIG